MMSSYKGTLVGGNLECILPFKVKTIDIKSVPGGGGSHRDLPSLLYTTLTAIFSG